LFVALTVETLAKKGDNNLLPHLAHPRSLHWAHAAKYAGKLEEQIAETTDDGAKKSLSKLVTSLQKINPDFNDQKKRHSKSYAEAKWLRLTNFWINQLKEEDGDYSTDEKVVGAIWDLKIVLIDHDVWDKTLIPPCKKHPFQLEPQGCSEWWMHVIAPNVRKGLNPDIAERKASNTGAVATVDDGSNQAKSVFTPCRKRKAESAKKDRASPTKKGSGSPKKNARGKEGL